MCVCVFYTPVETRIYHHFSALCFHLNTRAVYCYSACFQREGCRKDFSFILRSLRAYNEVGRGLWAAHLKPAAAASGLKCKWQ